MTKPASPESPSQQLRKFFLPFIYGITTANFIAVIQLVSAPQIQVDWGLVAAMDEGQIPRFVGFVGMVWMIASIPILVACAIHSELIARYVGPTPAPKKPISLLLILVFGILGIPLTLTAFHPAFGISFVVAMIISLFVADIAMTRFFRNDPRV